MANTTFSGPVNSQDTVVALKDTALLAGGAAAFVATSTAGSMGVYCGSGAPTVAAAKGSLYLRSDGSSVSTRAYINTDGGTTWTAITTAA